MDDPDDRTQSDASSRRKPSREFDRFESLTRRLLAVPKKAINGQGERQKAKRAKRSAG